MPVPSTIADLSTTAASNSPAGTESIGTNLDNYLRAVQAIVKQNASKGVDIASASNITIPDAGSYFVVTGTTTIATITDSWNGRLVVLEFSGALQLTNSANLILPGGANITTAAGDVIALVNESTGVYRTVVFQPYIGYATITNIQNQAGVAYTTGGSSTAYTLTPSPAVSAIAENQEFDVEFHTAAGTTPTLSISGLTAKSLKYRDSTGTLQAVTSTQIPSGWRSKVTYDGTDYIVREIPPAATSSSVTVRQTVLSGPVDSSGYAAFGGSTGSTTVTASGTLKATAAAGGDANYSGSITNPSWTGLSTNGTMYLYLDITSAGVVTTGSTTLAPTYQWGGAYSTTNGQHTFNIQEMTMKVGDGSAANQVYRVFVGEVTVSGNVVTAITWYALMGRYNGPENVVTSSATNNHNIGVVPQNFSAVFVCKAAEHGYAAGDEVPIESVCRSTPTLERVYASAVDRLTASVIRNTAGAVFNRSTGTVTAITEANWRSKIYANRGW